MNGLVAQALRRGVLVALAGLLVACGGGGGGGAGPSPEAPVGAQPGADYFPLAVGDRWYYGEGSAGWSITRVTGTQAVAAGTALVVRTQDNDGVTHEYYLRDATGVRLVPGPGSDAVTTALGAIQLLRLPLVAGDRWMLADKTLTDVEDLDRDGRPDTLTLRMESTVLGFETLTVAGVSVGRVAHVQTTVVQSARLTSTGQTVTQTITSDDWYAPDLGLVRNRLTGVDPTPTDSTLSAWRVGSLRSESQPPVLTARTPQADEQVGGCCIALSLSFSEPMDTEADAAAVQLIGPDGKAVGGRLIWQPGGAAVGFVPTAPLSSGSYTVRVAAQDRLGNAMSPEVSWQFTVDASGPAVTPVRPLPNAEEVALDTDIVFTLEADADMASLGDGSAMLSDGSRYVEVTVRVEGQTVTLTPKAPLTMGTRYQVRIAYVRDRFGNTAPAMWMFSTDPGRFAAPQLLDTQGVDITASAMGDLDGDGRQDIVLATGYDTQSAANSFKLRVLKGRTDGGWAAPLSVDTAATYGARMYSLFVAELGGRKAVVTASAGQAIQILRPQADGSLASEQLIETPASYLVQPADINGDGRTDLVGRPLFGTEVGIWLQGGDGRFGAAQTVALESGGRGGLAVGDLNGDGRPDLVTFNTSTLPGGQIGIALQQADGSFGAARYMAPPEDAAVDGGAIGDVNGDGRADLVLALRTSSAIVVLQQDAQGQLTAGSRIAAAPSAMRVHLADFDGDGRLDVLSSASGGWSVAINRQRADGSLGGAETFPTGQYGDDSPGLVAVGDVNADGRLDIVYGPVLLKQRAIANTPPPSAAPVQAQPSKAKRFAPGRWAGMLSQ